MHIVAKSRICNGICDIIIYALNIHRIRRIRAVDIFTSLCISNDATDSLSIRANWRIRRFDFTSNCTAHHFYFNSNQFLFFLLLLLWYLCGSQEKKNLYFYLIISICGQMGPHDIELSNWVQWAIKCNALAENTNICRFVAMDRCVQCTVRWFLFWFHESRFPFSPSSLLSRHHRLIIITMIISTFSVRLYIFIDLFLFVSCLAEYYSNTPWWCSVHSARKYRRWTKNI